MLDVVDGHRTYRRGDEDVVALRGVDFTLSPHEYVALVGPSGSGKSTLLLVLAGWESLDVGTVGVTTGDARRSPADLSWDELAVVPQALGLLDDLTVFENVTLPARLGRRPIGDDHVAGLMDYLDIEKLRNARATETSLGEQQRTAVARALSLRPSILLADEPSTHQDAAHGAQVFAALREAADAGCGVLVATHDPDGLRLADRVVTITDGRIKSDVRAR